MYLINKLSKKISILLIVLCLLSCKKFIAISPPETQIISSEVFNSDATAVAAMAGIYNKLYSEQCFAGGGGVSVSTLYGLYADELTLYSNTYQSYPPFYSNTIDVFNSNVATIWADAYNIIYAANSIIEGMANSSGVSAAAKKQLEGEAKFVRAFCHFYLVNLFGDVPYVKTSDYRINTIVSRTPTVQVYLSIITDLSEAKDLLSDGYTSTERVRPNKWTAIALLARAYLYSGNWPKAEEHSASIINNSATYEILNDLNTVFLKNSRETIWQLMPNNTTGNTREAITFYFTGSPSQIAITNHVLNSFELGDTRKVKWLKEETTGSNSYYRAFKYKLNTATSQSQEYSMVLRLAEQYLIRAEARAQQNNIVGSQADINVIRSRAFGGPNPTIANDKASLLTAIEHERRVEFFTEWGHRFFDLKRTNRANAVLGPVKPGWNATDTLLPIPQSERDLNSNLTQNAGY